MWGQPVPFGPVVPKVTSFEEAVKELQLQPEQYLHSSPRAVAVHASTRNFLEEA
jgi:hypothetical protein